MRAAEVPSLEQSVSSQKRSETQKHEEHLVCAFLRQRYPLSEEGIALRKEVEAAQAANDAKKLNKLANQLPTVEHPRLEFFRDFTLSPEQQESVFDQEELANVQVTKGCRHQCTFCAAGAAKKVEIMPFPAVLKIAEKKQVRDKKMEELWVSWAEQAQQQTGFDLASYSRSLEEHESFSQGKSIPIQTLRAMYPQHPLSRIVKAERLFFQVPIHRGDLISPVTNYYDSDPFDYRDMTFLHEDGTPADFSDVVQVLASHIRPIHITTAGWPLSDQVAQRAAGRIVALCKETRGLLSHPRISINRYEATARRSFGTYREMMLSVIQTMNDIGPEVLLFGNVKDFDDQQFIREVIEYIRPKLEYVFFGGGDNRAWTGAKKNLYTPVSLFSGPMADASVRDDHHDVMSCMPGIHIWPDGTVALQIKKTKDQAGFQTPKGSRPQPTGMKLYELSAK